MNLIEALKTGKPIRRPIAKHTGSNGDGYLGNSYVRDLLVGQSKMCDPFTYNPMRDLVDEYDLLADDWEVRPEKGVTITAQQFKQALMEVMLESGTTLTWGPYVMKKLGLE